MCANDKCETVEKKRRRCKMQNKRNQMVSSAFCIMHNEPKLISFSRLLHLCETRPSNTSKQTCYQFQLFVCISSFQMDTCKCTGASILRYTCIRLFIELIFGLNLCALWQMDSVFKVVHCCFDVSCAHQTQNERKRQNSNDTSRKSQHGNIR